MAYENRVEAYAETPAELTFGSTESYFWIQVGPQYQQAMRIRIMGAWAKRLHESLGLYLNGDPARQNNEQEDDE